MKLYLPTDSAARKGYPMASGLLDYFPAALAEVARVSWLGNQKHNPGEPLHHARGKSMDHADCCVRHLSERGGFDTIEYTDENGKRVVAEIRHSVFLAWRALALAQQELEDAGAPLARGARLPQKPVTFAEIPCAGASPPAGQVPAVTYNRKLIYPLRQLHDPWCGLDTDHAGPCVPLARPPATDEPSPTR